jgi:hypothetical protein
MFLMAIKITKGQIQLVNLGFEVLSSYEQLLFGWIENDKSRPKIRTRPA